MDAKFKQKYIKLCGSWIPSKCFDFLDKKPCFSEIKELCLNWGIWFWITWLVIRLSWPWADHCAAPRLHSYSVFDYDSLNIGRKIFKSYRVDYSI